MKLAPIPESDQERLAALYPLKILDTKPEERFDNVTRLAQELFEVPIAYIALVDANRQWFKSVCGLNTPQTPRDTSFCGHAILQDEPLIIPDTLQDLRFHDNPMVVDDPRFRFYAGCPLQTMSGHKVATLCIADRKPREFAGDELGALKSLASIAQDQINLMDAVTLQVQLVKAKKEIESKNEFIRKALGCYVTNEVAEEVINSSQQLKLGGQKRAVSILMSDIRDFTPMSERIAPEAVVDVLNAYLDRMVEIIMRRGGIIDSFIGDAILVIFDSNRYVDHAQRAVDTALDMQNAMIDFNRASVLSPAGKLEMGIGINTGDAVVGNIGSEKRMKYTAIGETVNLASRIQGLTIGGQVLLSEATLNQVKDNFCVKGNLRVKVKGVAKPITIFEVARG